MRPRRIGRFLRSRLNLRQAEGRFGSEDDDAWFAAITAANRAELLGRRQLPEPQATYLHRALPSPSWKVALNALGAMRSYQLSTNPADLSALKQYFDGQLDASGRWLTPTDRPEYATKGYTLVYLAKMTGSSRYARAAEELATAFLRDYRRVGDGCLPYQPETDDVLVDALAMLCPFLASYALEYGSSQALDVSVNQLSQFIRSNVDSETHLPYHGYYAGGARHLGLHGWGRGTGWFLMGLIDTLLEMPADHPEYAVLRDAYEQAALAVRQYQRPDGHWHWAVLHQYDTPDTSTTSLVGYGLTRGLQAGLLDDSFEPVVHRALQALKTATRKDGVIDGALAECRGLGKYPQNYGPAPWLQGAASGFAALRRASCHTQTTATS